MACPKLLEITGDGSGESEFGDSEYTTIDCSDFTCSTIQELLKYLHGDIGNSLAADLDLLTLVLKLDLPILKATLETQLSASLTIENVAKTCNMARLVGSAKLEKAAMQFIQWYF